MSDQAKKHIERFRYANGSRLRVRNPLQLERNLNDDYVKFLGMGSSLVSQFGGILGMVTNRMFLDAESLVGLREYFCQEFSKSCFLDLHGSTQEARFIPRLADDENVFDINQGVAISLVWILTHEKGKGAIPYVMSRELIGSADRKFQEMFSGTRKSLISQQISPIPPNWWLNREEEKHGTHWSLAEVMPEYATLVSSNRDHLVIDLEPALVLQRVEAFRQYEGSDADLCRAFQITLKSNWNIAAARKRLRDGRDPKAFLNRIEYRVFDRRFICFHPDLVWGPSPINSRNIISRPFNLILASLGKNRAETVNGQWISRLLVEKNVVSSRDNASGFPLYLYPEGQSQIDRGWLIQRAQRRVLSSHQVPDRDIFREQERVKEMIERLYPEGNYLRLPNFEPHFLSQLQRQLDLRWLPDGRGDLAQTFGPEDVIHLIYSQFYSTTYRSRFRQSIVGGFPPVLIPSSKRVFAHLVLLGADLVVLHLLEDDYPAASWNQPKCKARNPFEHPITRYHGEGKPEVARGYPQYQNGKVYVNPSCWFDGVPGPVWEFHIGGYQVCEKWLKDRRGRVLSDDDLRHYQRVVIALNETIRLMKEIDEVIASHGGWPDAFVTGKKSE